MVDIYKNLEDSNPKKKRKKLIIFDETIADTLSNEKLNPIVTELSIRGRKLNISFVFITQSLPKDIRLNSLHDFIMKIPDKQKLTQIASHNSPDIDFNDFMNLYKKCTSKPYSFLVTDATPASDNPLHFTKNLIERI